MGWGWWSKSRATSATMVVAAEARGRGQSGEEEVCGGRKKPGKRGRERKKVVTEVGKGGQWRRCCSLEKGVGVGELGEMGEVSVEKRKREERSGRMYNTRVIL